MRCTDVKMFLATNTNTPLELKVSHNMMERERHSHSNNGVLIFPLKLLCERDVEVFFVVVF